MNHFILKTKVFMGHGSLQELTKLPITNACVVCDPYMVQSGMVQRVTQVLEQMGARFHIFSEVVPDPTTDVVVAGVVRQAQDLPDAVIALGGGSAIDTAKAMSFLYTQITARPKPLCVVIPTTSGTGTEVTSFSVITDPQAQDKVPLVDDRLLPDVAILDADFTLSVPPSVTADTGMDVLTHAIEAYVSTDATDFSDALAQKALALVFQYLPQAVQNGQDIQAREHLHNASCMAGVAFNPANLGISHSLAHALGAKFHIPHGRSNALLLPEVMAYNAKGSQRAAERYCELARCLNLPCNQVQVGAGSLIRAVRQLRKTVGIPGGIASQKVAREDFCAKLDDMVQDALADTCTRTNPRIPTAQELRELYLNSYSSSI